MVHDLQWTRFRRPGIHFGALGFSNDAFVWRAGDGDLSPYDDAAGPGRSTVVTEDAWSPRLSSSSPEPQRRVRYRIVAEIVLTYCEQHRLTRRRGGIRDLQFPSTVVPTSTRPGRPLVGAEVAITQLFYWYCERRAIFRERAPRHSG